MKTIVKTIEVSPPGGDCKQLAPLPDLLVDQDVQGDQHEEGRDAQEDGGETRDLASSNSIQNRKYSCIFKNT